MIGSSKSQSLENDENSKSFKNSRSAQIEETYLNFINDEDINWLPKDWTSINQNKLTV